MVASEGEEQTPGRAPRRRGGSRENAVRRLLLKAVVVPFLLVALATGWLVWQVDRLVQTARMLDETDQTVAQANQLLVWVVDKETALRAYLLTQDPTFLEPYVLAHPDVALDRIQELVSDDDEQLSRLNTLRTLYADWDRTAEAALADPVASRSVAAMRSHKALMDRMREVVDGLVAHERKDRTDRASWSQRETTMTFWGVGALGVCFVLVAGFLTRRQIHTIVDLVERERAARRTAEEALRMKDEFLCTLSHELRTPLTPILGWVSMLRARKPPHEMVHALEVIERNTRAEVQLVEDVLDCSRIVSGKLRVTPQMMDLASVVGDAVEAVKLAASGKGITLDVAYDPPCLRMVGDPARLRQVAWNLIGNAIKFTPAGGRVEVRVDLVESCARLRVRDTGPGITPEALPRLFERFWQADASRTRAHGGLGLGLAISKHLVEAHGGRIEAASEGLGRGATFTVVLPVVAVVSDEVAKAAAPPAPAPPAAPVATPEQRLDGLRVLVVDDDPGSLEVITAILRARGAEVHPVDSGPRALRLLASVHVDVVVSDIAMPGMDGYELIQRIRAGTEARRRRVAGVALTACTAPQDVTRALGSGFERHLAKPVSPVSLVSTLIEVTRAPIPS